MALREDEQFVYDKIAEAGGMKEVEDTVMGIHAYRRTKFYPKKDAMIAEWEIDFKNIYDLVISIFTATLVTERMTYQAMVGMLQHKIKLDDDYSRITIIADVIGIAAIAGLIFFEAQKQAEYLIGTEFSMDDVIPCCDKHQAILLRPQPIETNWDKVHGSVVLGGSMNHHEGYVRLSHLNRMGQIAYSLNEQFIKDFTECPKEWPADEEGMVQWEEFEQQSAAYYERVIAAGNRYFIPHHYDSRGRQYAQCYYASPQGASFKKAIVEYYDKEIVEGF